MPVYYIILALILILGIPLLHYKPNKTKRLIYIIAIFSIMWIINTFRKGIGYDYNSYINIFNTIKTLDFSGLTGLITKSSPVPGIPSEPGFALLSWVIGRFTSSTIVMYGIYNLIITVPIARFVYKYCEDAWISVWLYVTMFFFFTNMGFVRQSIACSIILLGFDFFRKKKTIPFLLIVLLAASFQYTALIVIPIYFATFIPINRYTIAGYVTVVVVAFLTSNYIVEFVTDYVYTSYKDSQYLWGRLGSRYIVLPAIITLALIALYFSWRKRNQYADAMLITAIISCTFWLFGSYKHMIIERFCMYTYIFTLFTLPSAISSLKSSPETYKKQAELEALSKSRKLNTPQQNQLEDLTMDIKDHVYYWRSAVVALLVITLIYFYSGVQIKPNDTRGFHGVYGTYPYQSHIAFLHTDSPPTEDQKTVKVENTENEVPTEQQQQIN